MASISDCEILSPPVLPPEFTSEPEDVSSFPGESVTLTCKGYGSPDPDILWSKIDDDDDDDDGDEFDEIRDNSDYDVGKNTLTIK